MIYWLFSYEIECIGLFYRDHTFGNVVFFGLIRGQVLLALCDSNECV
ncbi:hypothetical protein VSP9026_01711 [Vibrio spartinae]|uniref:Uncharacterized protein n=1 Tax=Vibrio spartinae TaxID=1918945 RepID=A0A1N6M3S1_9VIBR|nr:hypothetical protein VSP9026_01711 [Vibrio spartinae]